METCILCRFGACRAQTNAERSVFFLLVHEGFSTSQDFGCDLISSVAMALVDSEAAFAQRCKEVDAEGLLGQLAAQGLTTFAKLAYACSTPQEKPTSAEFEAFTGRVLGAAPRLGDVSLLKRLMFEAATFVIAQLKQAVQSESTEAPRRLPAAEKMAREVEQRTRLAGVNIERELVPSHALIDLCHNMVELNSITWISPSKCTSRESEIQLSTRDQSKVFKLEDHTLKVSSEAHKDEADYSSPLKLQWCLQRRGLALDQCKLMSWTAHEKWVRTLLQSMTRDCPADFTRPNLAQLVQADREAFLIMAAEVRDLRPRVDGSFPMSVALDALRTDPRITMFLMAMPFKRSVAVDVDRPPTPPGAAAAAKTRSAKRREREKRRRDAEAAKRTGADPPRRADPPNKGARMTPPAELASCHQKTSDGKPICWSHNLKDGCKAQTSGSPPACSRGVHVCAFCRKPGHSFQNCRARNWKGSKAE